MPTISLGLGYAVYNEESGRMMEMRDLVRHLNPEIRKRWIKAVSNEYGRLMKGIGKKLEK